MPVSGKGTVIVKPLTAIFCEDIRQEKSGKEILIGVFGGEIVVPRLPVSLGVAIFIPLKVYGAGTAKARIRVLDPSGGLVGQTVLEQQYRNILDEATANAEYDASVSLPVLHMQVAAPGKIQVLWADPGQDYFLVGEKQVRVSSSIPSPPAT